jgi:hypothetical protein
VATLRFRLPSARRRCDTERANRSNFHTITESNFRLCASCIMRSSCGRLSFVPLIPMSTYSPASVQPRRSTYILQLPRLRRGVLTIPRCTHSRVDCDSHQSTFRCFGVRTWWLAGLTDMGPGCRIGKATRHLLCVVRLGLADCF